MCFAMFGKAVFKISGLTLLIHSPLSPALAEIARGDLYAIWQQINHPEFSAAYPPVALLFFRFFAWLNPDPFFFKAVMIGFDIGVMIVLMLMIKQRGVLPSRLLLYAANPLILLYISGEGHLDIIQVFFLCLALYLILCKKSPATGFLMLGLAILSKYFALVALPFLVNGENRTKSLAVLIPLILYIPYMDAGAGIFQSLGEFGTHFHYNDSMTVLIRYLTRRSLLIRFHLFGWGSALSGCICLSMMSCAVYIWPWVVCSFFFRPFTPGILY